MCPATPRNNAVRTFCSKNVVRLISGESASSRRFLDARFAGGELSIATLFRADWARKCLNLECCIFFGHSNSRFLKGKNWKKLLSVIADGYVDE
jgi:hypothetical protein